MTLHFRTSYMRAPRLGAIISKNEDQTNHHPNWNKPFDSWFFQNKLLIVIMNAGDIKRMIFSWTPFPLFFLSWMKNNWKINLPQSPILTNDIKLSKQAPSKPEEGISSGMLGDQRNVSHDKIWMKSVLRINFHQIRNQLLNTS